MATVLPAQRAAIVNLYSALFNRAPDASGLAFWAQAYADGASLAAITQSFLGTTEGRLTYPSSQTSTQFVAAFYQTVFGRAADAGGLAFWTSALDAAGGAGSDAARAMLAGQIVGVLSQSLTSKPEGLSDAAYVQTLADRTLFANKAVVGDYVAGLNINDVVLARQVLALVTADSASIPIAKAFAANGGVVPTPEPPMPTLSITSADLAADIVSKFAAYTGNIATVDAMAMVTAQFVAVAGGIAKVASGGIGGVLGLTLVDYAGTALTTLAPKLAAGATLVVTGTASSDTIVLKEFQRGTTINGGDGNDSFQAVVDAVTPANTTLSAHHTIVGGAGLDGLSINVTGNLADLLNGVTLSSVETLFIQQNGGVASVSANAEMTQIGVSGSGDLTVNNMTGTNLVLDGTASTGSYTLNTVGVANVNLLMITGAQANVVTVGGSATTVNLSKAGAASLVTSLKLADGVSQLNVSGAGDAAITGLAGNAAGGLSITITGSGLVAMNAIDSPVTSLTASAATGRVVAVFNQSVQTVIGGSAADILSVSQTAATGGTTLTGGAGADVFVLRAGVGLAGPADNATLLAKLVTITDFSVGDQLEIEATPAISGAGSVQVVAVAAPASLLDAASQAVAGGGAKPYLGFVYQAASYLLVDGAGDGLGAGDVLVKLTGVNLANLSYTDGNLTTV